MRRGNTGVTANEYSRPLTMKSNFLDRRLSLTQLRDAYDAAQKLGLDAAAFTLLEQPGERGCLIHRFEHAETRSFFEFDWVSGQYRFGFVLRWWPNPDGREPTEAADTWPEALRIWDRWLRYVRNEIATPDVWAIARAQRAWLTSSSDSFERNDQFTPSEREQIVRHLKTIEDYAIKTYQLHDAQADYVRTQIAYLSTAVERVGRFDWKHLAASTFISIVLTLGLDPGKAQQLIGTAVQLLGHLIVGTAKLIS